MRSKPTTLSWKRSPPSLGNKSYRTILSNSLLLWCIQGGTNSKMLSLFCPLSLLPPLLGQQEDGTAAGLSVHSGLTIFLCLL